MSKLQIVKSDAHAQAIKERDEFLDSHPELKALQAEIDKRLDNAQSPHNRLVLIHDLMMKSFQELHTKLGLLSRRGQSADPESRGQADG
ncbi:MAG: DUF3135 domain-containing protein [Deltaproteobacteria bacterium]|nr:DUF3135 domain-containing protein [Deltaproteobacteria bacterium]